MVCTVIDNKESEELKFRNMEKNIVKHNSMHNRDIQVKIVEDRIPNGYFDGSVKQKLDSALQKEISADCKEVTKASGANVLVCSPERGPLQQQVLGKASKRADSDAQSLEPAGGGPARPLRRSSQ
ncbi:hypothetical protein PIB30_058676 [Stylosanthes scabra]|uniref:Uncharacterized protein n=1 Tax=Stylosanthes scabra TaxID=79078 RepID=A0ABU6TKM5_9FABA|nr:hypothetical protein [Stylosanthes scabra]